MSTQLAGVICFEPKSARETTCIDTFGGSNRGPQLRESRAWEGANTYVYKQSEHNEYSPVTVDAIYENTFTRTIAYGHTFLIPTFRCAERHSATPRRLYLCRSIHILLYTVPNDAVTWLRLRRAPWEADVRVVCCRSSSARHRCVRNPQFIRKRVSLTIPI